MAKKKKKRRSARKPSLLVGGTLAINALNQWTMREDLSSDPIKRASAAGVGFIQSYTAVDVRTGEIEPHRLTKGLIPLVIAIMVKRYLGRYVSPYLKGLPISF